MTSTVHHGRYTLYIRAIILVYVLKMITTLKESKYLKQITEVLQSDYNEFRQQQITNALTE